MPVVPLLAGLVAVLAVALVLLVVAERRAGARVPDDAALADLRVRLDALRRRYAEIGAEVSALVTEAGAVTMEGNSLEVGQPASLLAASPAPPAEPSHSDVGARYVSTTAPATVRRPPSPPASNVPAHAPAASA